MPTALLPWRPPILSTSTVVDGVVFSSDPNFVRTTTLSPKNFPAQWHC